MELEMQSKRDEVNKELSRRRSLAIEEVTDKQRRDLADLEFELSRKRQEFEQKQEEAEREYRRRLDILIEREKTLLSDFEELQSDRNELSDAIEDARKKAFASCASKYDSQIKVITTENEAQVAVLNNNISNLIGRVNSLEEQLESSRTELSTAYKRITEIAVNTGNSMPLPREKSEK